MSLIVYCIAALTSFSDSVSYVTFLFLEWCIALFSRAFSQDPTPILPDPWCRLRKSTRFAFMVASEPSLIRVLKANEGYFIVLSSKRHWVQKVAYYKQFSSLL